ncbi:MAG TPA: ATP-binding cassette domain-containing protein, partial [Burkholderiaceae bacterium]|nr:ATP-binding cassette domain-containing protein [Burkholderiaceae bacterium]
MSDILLNVNGIEVIYNHVILVLKGVSLQVPEGRVVALLGGNGAGKTTTLRAVVGLLARVQGRIEIAGRSSIGLAPEAVARLGVAYCPEERGIFASLTVEENLMLPPVLAPGGLSVSEIY